MAESAEKSARRKALAREAARRRSAVNTLLIGECTCRYGASVLANGSDPAEARAAALEVAAELSMVAETLRRLTRLGPADRRAMAARLAAVGWPKHRIAVQLGVSDVTVFNYLRPDPGRGVS